MDIECAYHIKLTSDPMSWFPLPDSHRVFVDGGCAMFYDKNDVIIVCYGAGQWIEIIHDDVFEKMHPSMPFDELGGLG